LLVPVCTYKLIRCYNPEDQHRHGRKAFNVTRTGEDEDDNDDDDDDDGDIQNFLNLTTDHIPSPCLYFVTLLRLTA
jgi:hypothetical protein